MKKRTKSTQQFNLTQQAVLAAIICGAFNQVQALPMGEQVQAGSVNFVRDGQSLSINQFSQKTIVNWQSFGIMANEAVRLNQPIQGVALFRVLGSDPSQIFGSLTATGSLFLSNPNGVLFGSSSQVDVGNLVATTMRMNDADFLNGNYRFFTNPNDPLGASVVNQGVIRATDGGYLVLLGDNVENSGTLEANRGSVVLGSAQSAILDFYGDGLVRVKLDGDALKTAINNIGSIRADGGAVQLATNARSAAINVDGIIQANSIVERNGVIRLEGGKNAKVSVSGTLSAAGNENATTGGRIEVTGEQVALFKGAKLDASGDAGGGTVLVGGDYQGKNAQVYNARTTYVDKDATINVDAKNNGNGGKAVVWADEVTRYYGSISAKGGKNGGNGGFAEVSGKRLLNFLGKADLSAENGLGGSLLLDPLNITLTTADANTTGFTVPGDLTEAFADDAGLTSTFNVNAGGSFAGITAGSTITLQATNDINVNTAFNVATATGTANNSLVLQANNNINLNAAVTATGTGSITLTADADTSGAGGVTLGANLSAGAGTINLSGATVSGTGNIASTGLKTITATTGASTLSGVISGTGGLTKAGAGTLTLTGNNTYTGATSVSTGTLGIQGPHASATSIAAGATVAFGGATNRTYATVFSGAGNIIKDGTNTATLTGANTYTGNTTINTGTLAGIVGATSALTVNAGATYSLNNANRTIGSLAGDGNVIPGTGSRTLSVGGNNTSTTFSGVLGNGAGTLNLTKTGTGVLTLSGANIYTGTTTINAGTLQLAGGVAIADTSAVTLANVAGATLDLNGSNETIGSLAGGGATGGNVTLGAGTLTTGVATNTTYSGVISGAGGLIKTGTGTMTLSGANTYTGATNINVGTLLANNNTALGTASGGTTVASGATLAIQGGRTITDALTIAGNGVGGTAGALRNISGNNTYSGAITLGAGGARINSDANTLTISGAGNITGAELLTVGGTGSTTISKVIATGAGSVTKDGAGTLTLSGANTYTGIMTVTAGTLTMGANNVFADTSSILVNGGTLNANTRTDTVAGVRLDSGSITGTTGALTSTSTYDLRSGMVSKILGGAVGLNKTTAGTVTLSGANTYTGATNISAGTLIASTANALGAIGGGTIVASGATLNVNNVTLAESVLSINGTGVGSAGALTGTGAAVLSGAVTTTGASNIGTTSAASTLTLNGLVTATAGNLGIIGTGNVIATNNAGNNFGTVNINGATNVSLRDTNGIVVGNGTSNLTGNLSLQTGGSITQTDGITVSGATTLNAGVANDITLNNVANNFNSVAITSGRDVNVLDANALTLNASSVRTITARTLSSDLTLGGNITATGADDAIVLASAGNFINASNSSLTPGTGRWLVYSTDPALDNRGAGLLAAYDFKQYNTAFGGVIAGAGDGFIYTIAPTITPTLTGTATKGYDGTTTAPIGSLALGQTGAIDGDTITFAGLASATYDDKNAGVGKVVSTSGISFIGTGANNSGKTVYGYQLASPTATGAVGTINQRAITVTAATDNKTYDANTSSVGAPTITIGSIVGGDSTTFSQTFDNKNAGTGKTLTAAGTVTDGNGGNNYAVTFVTDNTGVINPFALTGAITADNKTYDANNSAVIASRNLTGVIIGDTVSYTGGTATFDNKNAGAGKTVTATGLGLSGGDAGNYTVNTTAVTTADIAKADITAVTGISANNKVYDATTAANLNTGTSAFAGMIGGDNLTVATATGNFIDANAGVGKTVNVTGISLGGADAANYNLTITTASTTADINQRAITVTANSGQSKVFGSADPLPFTFTVGGLGLVGADTLTGALDRVAGEMVASYAINQGSLAASSNYILSYFGNNFNILAPSTTGGSNPRNTAGLVDLNPSLGNYTNQQLFVLNLGFTAAGADSESNAACEENPESLAKDKDFILMLNYGLKLPKGVNASCDKHSSDKT